MVWEGLYVNTLTSAAIFGHPDATKKFKKIFVKLEIFRDAKHLKVWEKKVIIDARPTII